MSYPNCGKQIECSMNGIPGLILGSRPANERQRYFVSNDVSHWLGASLESALSLNMIAHHTGISNKSCFDDRIPNETVKFSTPLWPPQYIPPRPAPIPWHTPHHHHHHRHPKKKLK